MDLEQSQRRDIDTTLSDRITLAIDEENDTESPYEFTPTEFVGNNWLKQSNSFVKLNLAEQDSIIFLSAPLDGLLQKDITNIIVGFDYDVSNVSANYPILSNISLTLMEMTNYFLVENILTTQGHIDVSCSLFNFSSSVVNTAISEQGFKVGINFNGVKSNATVKLCNVTIKFEFQNKLQDEIDAVINRANVDGKLVTEITSDSSGDVVIYTIHFNDGSDYSLTTGSGGGSVDIATSWGSTLSDAKVPSEKLTKESLDGKISTSTTSGLVKNDGSIDTNTYLTSSSLGNYVQKSSTTGLIKNDGTIDTTSYLSSLPSHTHDDRYYTESEMDTALSGKQATLVSGSNIKTINNNSILGSGNITIQGGSGSVIGTGSFSIDNNGHLIVELPNAVDNPYYIDNSGHLIYDTSNTHNGS